MAAKYEAKGSFATLLLFNEHTGRQARLYVHAKQELVIGRQDIEDQLYYRDLSISNRQLCFRPVLYDDDGSHDVPPMVYVDDLSRNGTDLISLECFQSGLSPTSTLHLDRNHGSVLLDEADVLVITPNISIRFNMTIKQEILFPRTTVQEEEVKMFEDSYRVTERKIGVGGHGAVYVAKHAMSQRQMACKIINLDRYLEELRHGNVMCSSDVQEPEGNDIAPTKSDELHMQRLQGRIAKKLSEYQREHEVLKDLSHPNIIAIEQVFLTPHTIYIIQELVTGGDLFSYVESKQDRHLSDTEAAVILRQLLKAIDYLHDNGVTHRDLKPENILMTSWKRGSRVLITDFGHARRTMMSPFSQQTQLGRQRMFTQCGTRDFIAPYDSEIHGRNQQIPAGKGYSNAIDMWSLGAIAAVLLTGDVLFTDREQTAFDKNPLEVALQLSERCDTSVIDKEDNPVWAHVGSRPKSFVKALLVLDENKRLTAKQALQHAWFSRSIYAAKFEAIYQRAVSDWKPPRQRKEMVRWIDTRHLGPSAIDFRTLQGRTANSESGAFAVRENSDMPDAWSESDQRIFASPASPM